MRPSIGHGTRNQPKEDGEDDIHEQVDCKQGCEELRPGQRNCEMIGIAHIEARNTLLLKLIRAKPNPRRSFVGLALHSSIGFPSPLHLMRQKPSARG